MAGTGFKLFANGEVLNAADVNTYLQQQTVMVFASAAARTTALSGVLAEGMCSYLQDDNTVYVYNGSAWVNIGNSGDITGITATSPLTGGGTSGDITVGIQAATTAQSGAVQLTDSTSSTSTTTAATPNSVKTSYDLANAAIPKSTVTTSGDLIYATGSGTVTRLGIGSSGQVLTVSGGAPSWGTAASGGGWTSLASGSCSGSAVSLSSISGSYKNLRLVLRNAQFSNSTEPGIRLNSDTGSNYSRAAMYQNAATGGISAQYNTTYVYTTYNTPQPNTTGTWIIDIPDYANSSSYKIITCNAYYRSGASGNPAENVFTEGAWNSTAAVTAISFFSPNYTFTAGTYILYGEN